jgi:CHASE3 domain sensor protein
MTIRQTLFLFFIVIVIFLLNFFIDQRLSQQVVTNTHYLNSSEEIIRNSHTLHISISDMLIAFRGFLLTGDEIFLGPYYGA